MYKKNHLLIYVFLLTALPSFAAAQSLTLAARQAVDRAEPLAKQWAADATLIFVGTATVPGMSPDGKDGAWACGYYSAAKDSARNYYAALDGPVSYEAKSPQQYPSLQALGLNWRDSDAAGQNAETRGGAKFRAAHPDAIVQAALYWGATGSETGKGEWGLWWWFAYFSPAASTFIKFELSAFTFAPRPRWIVTASKPPLSQDIPLNTLQGGRLAVLNFSAGALDSVRLEAFTGLSPDTTGTRKAVLRYYHLNAFPDTAFFTATLTMYYVQTEFNLSEIRDEAGLKLYRNAGEGWKLVGGTADSASKFVIAVGVTQFSMWAIANPNDQPLAVLEKNNSLPTHFTLAQNYPNPFNPTTAIEFALPKASFVTLKIYDVLGKEVATLVAEKLSAGKHTRVWEAKGLASGVYVYRINTGEFEETKKLILLR